MSRAERLFKCDRTVNPTASEGAFAIRVSPTAVLHFVLSMILTAEWFDEGRTKKNSCGRGFGNFELLFGNVGAKLARD